MKLISIKTKDNSVVLDIENHRYELDQTDFIKLNLHLDETVSSASFNLIEQFSNFYLFKKLSLNYASRALKTKKQIDIYLKRKGAAKDQISEIVSYLESIGLINDKNYASAFISSRNSIRPTSNKKLYFDLIKKGIDKSIAEEVLRETSTDETANLKKLIIKKQRQSKYQDKQKLAQYLYRQGFSYSLVKKELL